MYKGTSRHMQKQASIDRKKVIQSGPLEIVQTTRDRARREHWRKIAEGLLAQTQVHGVPRWLQKEILRTGIADWLLSYQPTKRQPYIEIDQELVQIIGSLRRMQTALRRR